MKQMIVRLKHIFIALYILQILCENKIVNQSMKYKLQTDPNSAHLSAGDMYTRPSHLPKASQNAEHKC